MNYIKGKIKKIIFQNNDTGYLVALFRVKETNIAAHKDKVNKTITVTGTFLNVYLDLSLILYGDYINNERFGLQFAVQRSEGLKPTTKDAIIEFLSSSFVDGCGSVTAQKIYDVFGDKTIDIISGDKSKLLKVEGMTLKRCEKIYNSLQNFNKESKTILKLQDLGFSIDECSRIYNHFKDELDEVLEKDFFALKEVIEFHKLDNIYIKNYGDLTETRIYACLLQSMQILSDNLGDTYYFEKEIKEKLLKEFNIELLGDAFLEAVDDLKERNDIYVDGEKIYLKKYYELEINVAKRLKKIDSYDAKKIRNFDEKINSLEKMLNIKYNEDQKKAIKTALNNNITIISGGPGTGKTTIVNAIVQLYMEENRLSMIDAANNIALLAPTGRASKKLSTSTNMGASTIHRYLKWYKDSKGFFYNEFNKTKHKMIIVDEVSMIDIELFSALLDGISPNIKLILVGDTFQLPSVGPGLVLKDLIESDYFNYVPLGKIYRQSDNSYIPFLAQEIKNNDLSEDFLVKRDDYSFFEAKNTQIKDAIDKIIDVSIKKGIDERKMQVLAPMYRGDNGIDNLNVILQKKYNPSAVTRAEITYMDYIYREGDKVLQLVNNLDAGVFNGDIGFISNIFNNKITIDFEGNTVVYEKKDLKNIKHAYAITIHKSQGSEFEHVIMPISSSYYRMLYNKLVYTGVSRAKKSLTIVGDPLIFKEAVNNNYSSERKTSLKKQITLVYEKV